MSKPKIAITLSRRSFVAATLLCAPFIANPVYSASQVGTDRLWMVRAGVGDEIRASLKHESINEARKELARLSWFFRDWKDNDKAVWADPSLFILLAKIQTGVSNYVGRDTRLLLTSGYRTPERNATIEGAAVHSFHLVGKAADIIFPEVPASVVAKIALQSGVGGLGRYGDRFVHVDTGPKGRRWGYQ